MHHHAEGLRPAYFVLSTFDLFAIVKPIVGAKLQFHRLIRLCLTGRIASI